MFFTTLNQVGVCKLSFMCMNMYIYIYIHTYIYIYVNSSSLSIQVLYSCVHGTAGIFPFSRKTRARAMLQGEHLRFDIYMYMHIHLFSGEWTEQLGVRGIHIPSNKWGASWDYELSFESQNFILTQIEILKVSENLEHGGFHKWEYPKSSLVGLVHGKSH